MTPMANEQAEDGRRTPARLFTLNFIAVTLANLANSLGMQMLVATLPVYVISLGGTRAEAGLVSGALTLTSVFFRPLSGWLVDQGRRLSQVIFGSACYATASLIYLLAGSLPALLLGRFVHGVGLSSYITASYAYVADIAPSHRRAEAMGLFSTAYALALVVGPVIGFWLIASVGFTRMFYFTTGLYCTALAICLFARERRQAPADRRPPWSPRRDLLSADALPMAGMMFCMGVGMGTLTTFIAIFAQSRGMQNPGYYFMIEAIALLFSRTLTGRLADRYGRAVVIVPGLICMTASLLLLPWCHSFAWFGLSAVLFGYGFGSAQPAAMALLVDRIPLERRGIAISTIYTGFDGGISLGSILLGLVSQRWGFGALWLIAALCTLLGVLGLRKGRARRAFAP